MRRLMFLLIVLVSVISFGAYAQNNGSIKATVVDVADGSGVVGAVVEVHNVNTPDSKKYSTSAAEGKINVTSLARGTYEMNIQFMGYETITKEVEVAGAAVDLGTLEMRESAEKIDDVKIEVPAMRTSQKGDTVVYNAAAFKVTADSDTAGLLAKMPGITVNNGSVEAQGETVQRVLVDGKEFFTGDVASAISNLPAEVVDRVEVFSKLSDQAEFTGFDDGNSYMALNIITKEDKRRGKFGKLYAGFGNDELDMGGDNKYVIGGSVNFFKTTGGRLTLMGLANNVNQRDFTSTDILGLSGQSGISRGGMGGGGFFGGGLSDILAAGVNYDNDWWDEKLQLSVNYSYDGDKNRSMNSSNGMTYAGQDARQFDASESERHFTNRGHRMNARIEYKINDNNTIMMRPSVSYQSNFGDNKSSSTTWSTLNPDMVFENLTDNELVKKQVNSSDNDNSGYSISNNIIYRKKFGTTGRNIVVNLNGSMDRDNSDGLSDQLQYFYNPQRPDSLLRQNIKDKSKSYFIRGGISYAEPLSAHAQLSLEYNASYSYSDSDRKSFVYDTTTHEFSDDFDPVLSNVYDSGYLNQSIGPSLRISTAKTRFNLSVEYENSTLKGNQQYPVLADPKIKSSFNNVTYSSMLRINANSQNMFRFNINSNTRNPSSWDLRNVTDLSNLQNVRAGNPNLKTSYSSTFSAQWVRSNAAKGTTFMINGNYSFTDREISDSLVINQPDFILPNTDGTRLGVGNQFTKNVNLSGTWNTRLNVSYGFPLAPLRSNLNFNVSARFNQSPSMINGEKIFQKGQYYDLGTTLGSNISERLDFTLSYNGGYNISRSTYTAQGRQDNEYMSHMASGSFKWVTWKNFTLTANANYYQYKGITSSANDQQRTIVNLAVGKKVLKGLGEVSFGINDLLNENKSFNHFDTSTGYRNMTNTVLKRFYLVKFVYNLRSFGGGVNSSNFDSISELNGRGRGGRGGGFRGGFR